MDELYLTKPKIEAKPSYLWKTFKMNLWICFDWICAYQVVLMPGGPSEDLADSSSSWFFTTFPFSNISQQGFQTQSLLGHFAENFLFSHFFQPLLVWPALVTLGVIWGVTPGPSSSPHHIKVLQKQSQNSAKESQKSVKKKLDFCEFRLMPMVVGTALLMNY